MPIDKENILVLQEEFNLTYHVIFSKYCDDLVGFADKDVLEVGGSLPPGFVFQHLGAKSWTALETEDYDQFLAEIGGISHKGTQLYLKENKIYPLKGDNVDIKEKYRFFMGNIEKLPEQFYSKFDLVFSINCFEHLQYLPESLDNMYKALRIGGKLITIFAPIWSAFSGHHLPKISDKSGKIYHHDESPIPPWAHLTMNFEQMLGYLSGHVDKETANKMVQYIYESPFINRLFYEDYKQCFEMSDFNIERLEAVFPVYINSEMQKMLERAYHRKKQFANRGILFIGSRLD